MYPDLARRYCFTAFTCWGIRSPCSIGCIIQSDAIADMLEPIYHDKPDLINLLLNKTVSEQLSGCYKSLKDVIRLAIDTDAVIPALSATLDYLKSVAGQNLPTNFEESELDYCRLIGCTYASYAKEVIVGHHNYDTKAEHKLGVKKGSHHSRSMTSLE